MQGWSSRLREDHPRKRGSTTSCISDTELKLGWWGKLFGYCFVWRKYLTPAMLGRAASMICIQLCLLVLLKSAAAHQPILSTVRVCSCVVYLTIAFSSVAVDVHRSMQVPEYARWAHWSRKIHGSRPTLLYLISRHCPVVILICRSEWWLPGAWRSWCIQYICWRVLRYRIQIQQGGDWPGVTIWTQSL